jgi:glycosyltransferase involved in cell wall biosynthesis
MDVFVIPSHQEGLCIAALEAMACAMPVVSTRCGGPEEFVLDDHTGQLTASDPAAMAAAISSICQDRDRRERLAQGACRWINEHASTTSARDTFRRHFDAVYPSGPV